MLQSFKNKFISAVIISLLSFTALAEHKPYFKFSLGVNKYNKIDNFNNLKQESNFSPELSFSAGAGLVFDNSFRSEIIFTNTKVTFQNNKQDDSFNKIHTNTKDVVINSVMFNVNKDFFTLENDTNFFAGVGVGISEIKESVKWESVSKGLNNTRLLLLQGNVNRKLAYRFCYSLNLGMDFKVSDRFNIELMYQFKDNGVTDRNKFGSIYVNQKHYLSNSLTTSIKYNL